MYLIRSLLVLLALAAVVETSPLNDALQHDVSPGHSTSAAMEEHQSNAKSSPVLFTVKCFNTLK
jgi:hypothetical protein